MSEKRFTADMTVGEAYQTHPMAKQIFSYFHIGGCHHCAVDETITVEEACEKFGVPENLLLEQLNDLPEQAGPPSANGDSAGAEEKTTAEAGSEA